MRILVDADACPVKQIIVSLAEEAGLSVTMVTDSSHVLSGGYGKIVTVDKGSDSADFALMALLAPGDIVVTQDYGLAAMALGKGAKALNQDGLIFSDGNIDGLLASRHLSAKARRGGQRTKGPPKRSKKDDENFSRALRRLIEGGK